MTRITNIKFRTDEGGEIQILEWVIIGITAQKIDKIQGRRTDRIRLGYQL